MAENKSTPCILANRHPDYHGLLRSATAVGHRFGGEFDSPFTHIL